MATVELTSENFEAMTGGKGWRWSTSPASWCGPCRVFRPCCACQRHPDAVFGKVDTEAQPGLAADSDLLDPR